MDLQKIELAAKNPNVLQNFLEECKKRGVVDSLATCFTKMTASYNIFDLTLKYLNDNFQSSALNFDKYREALDSQVVQDVVDQVNSKLWHRLRQGRITASKLYEASQCATDGTLVQQILGGYKVPETEAIK